MPNPARFLSTLLAAATLAAPVALAETARTPATQPARTIVTLKGQRESFTISSTPAGPRYSVTDAAGRPLLTSASARELQKLNPRYHRLLESNASATPAARELIADLPLD
jgi:hypothetical protein